MPNVNKKLKILIVHNYYQISGGEDVVVANEKKMLEKYGHTTFLYSRKNSELKKLSKFQKSRFFFTVIFNIKTYKEIKEIIHNQHIDIVHVHNTLFLISPAVYYAAKNCNVPVIQTIHNFRMLCPAATFYRGHICEDCITKGFFCAVKHGCYRNSKLQTLACVISIKFHRMTGIYKKIFYICLTDFNKQKLLNLKQIKRNQIFVKPNFCENNVEIIPYEKRKDQFAFIGRLDKLKGIDILLQAWKMIEKKYRDSAPRLIICGIGPMDKWCHTFISENCLRYVEMKGMLPNIKAREILSISKALILPTQWYEGFPMTIVEAYSVGTPVIGSDIGNVGNLIQDGITGYRFVYNSVDSLVKIIEEKDFNICCTTKTVFDCNYTEKRNYQQLINIYQKCNSN